MKLNLFVIALTAALGLVAAPRAQDARTVTVTLVRWPFT